MSLAIHHHPGHVVAEQSGALPWLPDAIAACWWGITANVANFLSRPVFRSMEVNPHTRGRLCTSRKPERPPRDSQTPNAPGSAPARRLREFDRWQTIFPPPRFFFWDRTEFRVCLRLPFGRKLRCAGAVPRANDRTLGRARSDHRGVRAGKAPMPPDATRLLR